MEHYRAYKWAAVGFLVVFAGFVGAVSYWSGPASVEAVVEPSAPVAAPGGRVAPSAEKLAGGANVDIQPLLSSENELFLQGMIEQFSTRPAVGSAATVSAASIASATNEPIVVASSAPSASSGSDAGASSASGGSTSGGAGSTATESTPPRRTTGVGVGGRNVGANSTELRIPATFPIVHHKYFIGERELFGYSPLYQPNTVTFDINNRPTIRVGNIIQSLTGNSWTENNWYTAARRVFAGWRYAVQTGPFTDERVVFDSDGWAYTIINNYYHNRPNTPWEARLLYSPDYCVSSTPTWKGLYLGEGKARIEFNDSGNLSDYPPAVLRWSRPYPDPTPAVDTLHLDVLSKNGQTLIISDSTVITTIWMGGYQAGGGNWSVSTGSKIHIVYPENDGQSNGTPQYAVTYNRSSRTLSSPFLLGYGATGDPGNPPDRHCVPAITVDRDGYLHVILGAHNRPLQYRKSLAANSTAGWSDVEDIGLASVNSGYKNVFTYVSLICGNNNSIHVVARASGHGGPIHTGKHFLVYFRKKENHSWEVLNELVIPFKTNYSNYYHNLNIDRKGRLFLSYMYFANWMLQSEIAAYRAKWPTEIITLNRNKIDKTDPAGWRYDCRGAKPHDPVILMSDDGGDTWKLVTTGDFVEGVL